MSQGSEKKENTIHPSGIEKEFQELFGSFHGKITPGDYRFTQEEMDIMQSMFETYVDMCKRSDYYRCFRIAEHLTTIIWQLCGRAVDNASQRYHKKNDEEHPEATTELRTYGDKDGKADEAPLF